MYFGIQYEHHSTRLKTSKVNINGEKNTIMSNLFIRYQNINKNCHMMKNDEKHNQNPRWEEPTEKTETTST